MAAWPNVSASLRESFFADYGLATAFAPVADIGRERHNKPMKLTILAVIGAIVVLQGCSNWKPKASVMAPDRKTVAQIEVSLAGAPAGNDTRILLRNGPGGGLPKPLYVVEAENAIVDQTRLRWLDADHLRVSLCEATTFRVRAENMRDPPYLDAGRGDGVGLPNAVWVEVENLAYSETAKGCVPRSKSA